MKKTACLLLAIMWILLLSGNTALAANYNYDYTVSYTDGTSSETISGNVEDFPLPATLVRTITSGTEFTVTVNSPAFDGSILIEEYFGDNSLSVTKVDSEKTVTVETGKKYFIWAAEGNSYDTSYTLVCRITIFAAPTPEAPTPEAPTGKADPLPEDEIGTYSLDENGEKFYIQFHNYNLCMRFMNDESLCRNTSTNLYN